PNQQGIEPGYEEKRFDAADKRGHLRLVGSPDGAEGSVVIHQDVRLFAGLFDGDEAATLALQPGRQAYVHVARGRVTVNGQPLETGDAAKLDGESAVSLEKGADAEVLVFDLPA
ncbi:MAG: quercetin 2,3-dioxygenase, partial [Cupriavidus sp.]|nr:quercetin 2,3-dioxygenase [Cupriavidus sp.]